jgi:hypothetical protein
LDFGSSGIKTYHGLNWKWDWSKGIVPIAAAAVVAVVAAVVAAVVVDVVAGAVVVIAPKCVQKDSIEIVG